VSQNEEGNILFDGTSDLKGQVTIEVHSVMIYRADHAVAGNVIPSFQHIIVHISSGNDLYSCYGTTNRDNKKDAAFNTGQNESRTSLT
jgi:hypothetical protein